MARNIAILLLYVHRRLEPAAVPGRPSPRGPHSMICGDGLGGMTLGSHSGQSTKKTGCTPCGYSPHEFRLLGAGGTGIAPAPCGCGARGALSRVIQGRLIST